MSRTERELIVSLDAHEGDVCDELKRQLGLRSDRDLVRHALYRLAVRDVELDLPVDCFQLGEPRRRRAVKGAA